MASLNEIAQKFKASGLHIVEAGVGAVCRLVVMPFEKIPGFACQPTVVAPIGLAKNLCEWLAGDVRVMVVSEEGVGKCFVYFYADEKAAEAEAGQWKITSRVMFDITDVKDCSDLKELKQWGPAMPHNTIRVAAQRCKEAMLACKRLPFMQTEISDFCAICAERDVPTVTMPCCARGDSSNRICKGCQGRCKRCPFCRAPNTQGLATNFRKTLSSQSLASMAECSPCGHSPLSCSSSSCSLSGHSDSSTPLVRPANQSALSLSSLSESTESDSSLASN